MRITLRELRAIIHHQLVFGTAKKHPGSELSEDFFTKGMWTAPTQSGGDREKLRDLTHAKNPEDEVIHQSHLADEVCGCSGEDGCDCNDVGPVPPGNPSVIDNASYGRDPYAKDWNTMGSGGVSR